MKKVLPSPFQPGGGCPKRTGTALNHNICAKIASPNAFFPFFLAVRRIYPCFPAPAHRKRPEIRFFFAFFPAARTDLSQGQRPTMARHRWTALQRAACNTTFAANGAVSRAGTRRKT
ncbi:MAG: hypothetical protein LBT00_15330 [Spirochaetaceae bacterium]|nr:hypothetical protein [Spirochaetaceae bacterium]